MKKVLDCRQTRDLEQRAVDGGVSYLQLMENAGSAAARFLVKKTSVSGKRIAVLCGKGNNGGDGFVMAKYLADRGAKTAVVLAQGQPKTEIAQEMFSRLNDTTVRVADVAEEPGFISGLLASADYIVDAVYGIGFRGSAPDEIAGLLRQANSAGAIRLAVDIPSGAQCDTGAVEGECFQADYTVTFSTLKPAHLLYPAKAFCGQVTVAPVGIPGALIGEQAADFEVTDDDYVRGLFVPREENTNKGSFGTLLSVCGSRGMAGAAVLSASAALRCGVGLVNLALPASIYPIAASKLAEPVYTLLPDDGEGPAGLGWTILEQAKKKATACLAGCGLGISARTVSLVQRLIAETEIPLILDADGINAAAQNIDIVKTAKAPLILTPHPGEMARLMKTTAADVQANRLSYAKGFAKEYGVVLVLKGSGTIVAAPDGRVCFNPTGNPGMAKGGSGDVLAGMIASFAAQGAEPFYAAACGAYLHGLAGDLCARRLSQRAMLPGDMVEELPPLFLQFEK